MERSRPGSSFPSIYRQSARLCVGNSETIWPGPGNRLCRLVGGGGGPFSLHQRASPCRRRHRPHRHLCAAFSVTHNRQCKKRGFAPNYKINGALCVRVSAGGRAACPDGAGALIPPTGSMPPDNESARDDPPDYVSGAGATMAGLGQEARRRWRRCFARLIAAQPFSRRRLSSGPGRSAGQPGTV